MWGCYGERIWRKVTRKKPFKACDLHGSALTGIEASYIPDTLVQYPVIAGLVQ